MLQEEIEVSMVNPTPERISRQHKKALALLVERDAVPESVIIDSRFVPEKSILRITSVGKYQHAGRGFCHCLYAAGVGREGS